MKWNEEDKFNVVQFFSDGTYEYVRRNVPPAEAVKAAKHYITCVGARMGTTVKVLITDEDDFANFHWEFGRGIIFPTREDIEKLEEKLEKE